MQNKIGAHTGYFSVHCCSSVLQETDVLRNMGKKVFY